MDEKNQLQSVFPQLPVNTQLNQMTVHMEQSGSGHQIGYVNKYESNKKTTILLPPSLDDDSDIPNGHIDLDLSCYSLFVIADEQFKGKQFMVPKDKAINSCTPKDLMLLAYLTSDCIKTVKAFPAIFANRNHGFASTDEGHKAFFGIVLDVQPKVDGIWIKFYRYHKISQRVLNEHAADFDIEGTEFTNELDSTHWSIKRVNVVEALNKNGHNIKLI